MNEKIKLLSIIAIPYFTICGGLYHIAYWGTFNINGLEYFGLTDLIKSFVYPTLTFTVTFMLGYLLTLFNPFLNPGGGAQTKFGKFINLPFVTIILVILWFAILLYIYGQKGNTSRWLIWVIAAEVAPTIFLYRQNMLINIFVDNRTRMRMISSIVLLPIISFAAGKYSSELISENIRYKYVINTHFDSNSLRKDTLKFLGGAENYLFMTDMNNANTFIIRSNTIDTLVVKEYSSKK